MQKGGFSMVRLNCHVGICFVDYRKVGGRWFCSLHLWTLSSFIYSLALFHSCLLLSGLEQPDETQIGASATAQTEEPHNHTSLHSSISNSALSLPLNHQVKPICDSTSQERIQERKKKTDRQTNRQLAVLSLYSLYPRFKFVVTCTSTEKCLSCKLFPNNVASNI